MLQRVDRSDSNGVCVAYKIIDRTEGRDDDEISGNYIMGLSESSDLYRYAVEHDESCKIAFDCAVKQYVLDTCTDGIEPNEKYEIQYTVLSGNNVNIPMTSVEVIYEKDDPCYGMIYESRGYFWLCTGRTGEKLELYRLRVLRIQKDATNNPSKIATYAIPSTVMITRVPRQIPFEDGSIMILHVVWYDDPIYTDITHFVNNPQKYIPTIKLDNETMEDFMNGLYDMKCIHTIKESFDYYQTWVSDIEDLDDEYRYSKNNRK